MSHLPLGEQMDIAVRALIARGAGCPRWERTRTALGWSQSVSTHAGTVPRPARGARGGEGGSMTGRGLRTRHKRRFYKRRYTSEVTAAMGGPTPKQGHPRGTMAVENQDKQGTNEEEGAGEEKKIKKAGAAARNRHAPTQPPALLIASPKGLAGTKRNVRQKQAEGAQGGVGQKLSLEKGRNRFSPRVYLIVSFLCFSIHKRVIKTLC